MYATKNCLIFRFVKNLLHGLYNLVSPLYIFFTTFRPSAQGWGNQFSISFLEPFSLLVGCNWNVDLKFVLVFVV